MTPQELELDPTSDAAIEVAEPMQFTLDGPAKLTEWPKEPELLALKADLEAAKPSHDAQVQKIQRWTDLMEVKGTAQPKKIPGRSSTQPKLIRRQAEWRYAALSEPFLSSDRLFKIEPVTFEDEEAARQNGLVLNYQFRTKINRIHFIDSLVRATVDEGTAIARVGWVRQTKINIKEIPVWGYMPLSPRDPAAVPQVQILQQTMEMRQQNPRIYEESTPPEVKAAIDYLDQTGMPVVAVQQGVQQVEEEEILDNRPTVEILNPVNVYVDPSCQGDLDKALFVVVSFETNRAELLKDGDRYKNLDIVNWSSNSPITNPDHATSTPNTFEFRDSARKKVVAYEYWGFYDIQGNGELVPIVCTWIGDTIIRMEENPFPDKKLPFVMMSYLPVKREIYGEPDAELLEDSQKILGAVTRGMLDLLGNSANGQKGFAKGMLDPLNKRRYETGHDYEFNPGMPTNQGVIEHKYPEFPMSAMTMLQLQNQEAEALTGVKSFAGGLSGNAYGQVATGIRGMLDAASKREMGILRRIAKGVSDIGRKILAMNAEFLSDTETVRVTNSEFVQIHRDALVGEFDLSVDISTLEVDNTKSQDLGFMLQTLGPNMDPRISMRLLAEIAELKRMPVLAQELKTWQPQPDPVQQQIQQMTLAKLQMEVQVLQSEAMLNQAKAQSLTVGASKTHLDMIEQETGTAHARNIIETQAQAKANQELEITKAFLKSRKEGESAPDVSSAIGFNALTKDSAENDLRRPLNPQ